MNKNVNCWICGNLADSKEHKFKSSDIRRKYGKKFKESIIFSSGEDEDLITNYKDDKLQFPKVICRKCNNITTQPYDNSYDIFIEHIPNLFHTTLSNRIINLEAIFNNNWEQEKLNLYRYYAKHVGCKIITAKNGQVPSQLSEFVKGGNDLSCLKLIFVLKTGIQILKEYLKVELKKDYLHLANGSTVFYQYPNGLINYHGWISFDWLTVHWVCGANMLGSKVDFKTPIIPVKIERFDTESTPEQLHLINYIENYGLEELDDRINFIINNSSI